MWSAEKIAKPGSLVVVVSLPLSLLLSWRASIEDLQAVTYGPNKDSVLTSRFGTFGAFNRHHVGNAAELVDCEFSNGSDHTNLLLVIENGNVVVNSIKRTTGSVSFCRAW